MAMMRSATSKNALDPPATSTVETPRSPSSGRTRSTKGVIGSRFDGMSARIRSSRIMKFVAEVSSSMSRVRALASTASTRLAAWDVDPLAFVVEKNLVSVPDGRLLMNGEMSSPVTARPSSARMAVALGSVMTHSRPSSAMCG